MNRRLLLSAILMLLFAHFAAAQTSPSNPAATRPKPKEEKKEELFKDAPQDLSLPEEMRIRMAIERADNEHRKIIADTEKLNDLTAEVAKGFSERGQLTADELKKLSTIEKLAKRILNHAGGDEVDDKTGRIEQMPMADMISGLTTAAAVIKKNMTAETRHVVSATVIANSNDIINLAQCLRRMQKSN
jgi:predicted hydrolase (HD superfamily)